MPVFLVLQQNQFVQLKHRKSLDFYLFIFVFFCLLQGNSLHVATERGHKKFLVDKGADIGNKENSGVSDLF